MKHIILLGANGHVGAYTFDYLLQFIEKNGFHLIASGRRETSYYIENGYDYRIVDICEEESFNSLPQTDVYAVIDFAGIMPATMRGYDPYKYIDINIRGTLNVLEYCKRVNCNRIIVTTTEADLSGYWKPKAVIDADLPPRFDYGSNYSMYIISRCTVMEMLKNYYALYGIKPYVLRCSTIYCYTENPYMFKLGKPIIPGYLQIYDKAMKGENIELWGNPNVKTDIVYVKDFAQIVYKALIASNQGGIYNIGTGMPVTLKEQIETAIKVFSKEKKSSIIYCPDKPDGRDFVMDISKTCKELGYQPKYNYHDYLVDYKKEMELNRFKGLFTIRK